MALVKLRTYVRTCCVCCLFFFLTRLDLARSGVTVRPSSYLKDFFKKYYYYSSNATTHGPEEGDVMCGLHVHVWRTLLLCALCPLSNRDGSMHSCILIVVPPAKVRFHLPQLPLLKQLGLIATCRSACTHISSANMLTIGPVHTTVASFIRLLPTNRKWKNGKMLFNKNLSM